MLAKTKEKEVKNILFVCEGNTHRSPTFEIWFKRNRQQYDVKSVGTERNYSGLPIEELLEWADVVYVMDLEQEMFLARKFPKFLSKVTIIGCDDRYPRGSPQLFRLIEYWVKKVNL